jgi:glycosyltransferase involved in cell wall biosynthesis
MEPTLKKIGIVVPVYNEEKNLKSFVKELVQEAEKHKEIKQLIFVDDGSTDNSLKILLEAKKKNLLISLIRHPKNLGKGAALKAGLNAIKKNKYEAVIFMDADRQHKPSDLPRFIEKLKKYPVVFGFRNLSEKSPFFRRLGNQIAKFIVSKLFHVNRKDLLCGFMGFRQEIFKNLNWSSADYGVETEISTIIGKKRIQFEEINIENIYHDRNKGVNLFHAFLIFLRIPLWYFSKEKLIDLIISLFILTTYLLLSLHNPFGRRSLVANLEPYPDSLYYSTPAWNFIQGKGFNMKFFNLETKLIVPPLYGLYLLPFFYFFGDVRSFYYANMVLMLGSLIFFLALLKKIFKKNYLIRGVVAFLFATSFYFFNLPSLLMAENITLFFLLAGLNLLLGQFTDFRLLLLSFWGVFFWLIKFSNLPLGLVFYLLVFIKVFQDRNKVWQKKFFLYAFASGIIYLTFVLATNIFSGQKDPIDVAFSPKYFLPFFKKYLTNLFGGETFYLWYREKFTSPLIGWLALAGLIIGLIKKESRLASLQLLLFIVSLVFFMSFFYVQDARYILVILPLWLIFSGFLIEFIQKSFDKKLVSLLVFVLIAALLLVKNFGYRKNEMMAVSLKKQISLNLKYKEEPWNYLAVLNFNRFFENSPNKNSYLGTFLPPFFLNFYSNKNYQYLPLIESQDFFPGKGGFLEQMKIKNIDDYYRQLLKQNKKVFVSNYYAANLKSWQERFDQLKQNFKLVLKQQGCFDVCNIYQLQLKE